MSFKNVVLWFAVLFFFSFFSVVGYAVIDYLIHKRSSYAIAECNGEMKFADLRFIRKLKLASAAFVNPELVKRTRVLDLMPVQKIFELYGAPSAQKILEASNLDGQEGPTFGSLSSVIVKEIPDGRGREPLYCAYLHKYADLNDIMSHQDKYFLGLKRYASGDPSLYGAFPVVSWGGNW